MKYTNRQQHQNMADFTCPSNLFLSYKQPNSHQRKDAILFFEFSIPTNIQHFRWKLVGQQQPFPFSTTVT